MVIIFGIIFVGGWTGLIYSISSHQPWSMGESFFLYSFVLLIGLLLFRLFILINKAPRRMISLGEPACGEIVSEVGKSILQRQKGMHSYAMIRYLFHGKEFYKEMGLRRYTGPYVRPGDFITILVDPDDSQNILVYQDSAYEARL
jgi:hypothetical protein